MGCPDQTLLERWIDDRLNESESRELDAHLESCDSCSELLERIGDDASLEARVRSAAADQPADAAAPLGREDVAGYEILEELHRGGQGVVYAARQRSTDRSVAVKLLRDASGGGRGRSRFEREILLVKEFQHPHIVPIFDRGETSDGRLFYVMELVRGARLDEAALALTETRERVALMLPVLDAVRYAHGRGVIHRDLKPANILVDETGAPRVLDFGLARLIDDDLRSQSLMTHTGEFVGTVAYASPEQVRGDPGAIDVRTDVYSLGVVLYELVTGQLPYRATGSLREMLSAVEEDEPDRDALRSRAIDRDLVTILLTTLTKDPARRYQTVAELEADLHRYLGGDAILARPETRVELMLRFARRHRALLATTAVVLIALVAATVVSLSFALDASESRDQAQDRARRAEKILGSLREVFTLASPDHLGRDVKLLDALEAYEGRLESRFADEPAIAASLWSTVADTHSRFGEKERSLAAQTRATDAAMSAYGPDDARTLAARAEHATALLAGGRAEDGEEILGDLERRGVREGRLAFPTTTSYWTAVFERHRRHGEAAKTEEVARHRIALALEAGDEGWAAACKQTLANHLIVQRRFDEAHELLTEILAAAEEMSVAGIDLRLDVRKELATIDLSAGRYVDAEAQYRRLIEELTETFGESSTSTTRNHLAMTLARQQRHAEAIAEMKRAIAIRTRSHSGDDQTLLTIRANLGSMLAEVGALDEAQNALSALLDDIHRLALFGSTAERNTISTLAIIQAKRGEFDDALEMADRGIAIASPRSAAGSSGLLGLRRIRAIALSNLGRADEALVEIRETATLAEETFGADHVLMPMFWSTWGNAAFDAGEHQEAREQYERRLAAEARIYPASHPKVKSALRSVISIYEELGDAGALALATARLEQANALAESP